MADKPKPDRTPLEEVDDAIQENIRLGYMVEVSPRRFSLTEAGIESAKLLMKGPPIEDTLRTYVAAINGENDLNVGQRMCADAMDKAADEITRLNALVDEMREGLEHTLNGTLSLPRFVEENIRALITKASRDSGHG